MQKPQTQSERNRKNVCFLNGVVCACITDIPKTDNGKKMSGQCVALLWALDCEDASGLGRPYPSLTGDRC